MPSCKAAEQKIEAQHNPEQRPHLQGKTINVICFSHFSLRSYCCAVLNVMIIYPLSSSSSKSSSLSGLGCMVALFNTAPYNSTEDLFSLVRHHDPQKFSDFFDCVLKQLCLFSPTWTNSVELTCLCLIIRIEQDFSESEKTWDLKTCLEVGHPPCSKPDKIEQVAKDIIHLDF